MDKRRQLSGEGLEFIKSFEGLRLRAYKDSGNVYTIGYGHTRGVRKGDEITESRALEFLREDVGLVEASVSRLVTTCLEQHEFDALISFVFNVGAGAFASSTMLRQINERRLASAAAQFSRWNKVKGRVISGLTRRRAAERQMFEGGLVGNSSPR